tara:strand:+ start:196 stop:594 length:399 start_codon:yes stop_codon:yes gene_type:complete
MARPYIGGTSAGIKALSSSQTLAKADTGKVFVCSQSGGAYDITLPAIGDAKGWQGTFVLGTADTNDFDIIGGTADVMIGAIVAENGVQVDAADKITFASGAVVGDRIDVFCDGTNYYVYGFCVDDDHITASG